MRRIYEKPVINPMVAGFMNTFGPSLEKTGKPRSHIAGASVDSLVDRFGSPLFVYSEETICRQHREMNRAFTTRYPHFSMAWSYKTNYLSAVCALMHREGSLAEVVSSMEYEKAKSHGVAGDRIIFNGPCKEFDCLLKAAMDGAAINIDHQDEIEELEAVAQVLDRPISVGIRLNLDAGIQPAWSRFGFNLESGQALEAVRRMVMGGKLNLTGLHCHLGTYILDPGAYARQVEKMLTFAYEIEDSLGCIIETLDIGGGFPSMSRLHTSLMPVDVDVPTFDDFAEAICQAMWKKLRPGHFPKLIVESGRALIDEAGALITSVVATKRMPDGTRAYVVDAGINLLFTSAWYRFNIELDREVKGLAENSIIYGPLCMNIDVVDEGLMLPPLEKGARLIVSPAGAYNNTQWLQFIHYRPNVVLVGENGEVDVIREAEDLTDLTRRERLPARLDTRILKGNANEPFWSEKYNGKHS